MDFVNGTEKREWLGRQGILDLQRLYPHYFKWDFTFTDERYDCYDAVFFASDQEGKIKRTVWVEIKIRYDIHPDYILEKWKIKKLKEAIKRLYMTKSELTILYLNFTPEGTFIWDITDYCFEKIDPSKWSTITANKSTEVSRTDKTDKDVIRLGKDESKRFFEYVINERELLSRAEKKKIEEKKKKRKGKTIDDVLWGDDDDEKKDENN